MIEWLKIVLYKSVCRKIIIVVIYSLYFVDIIIIYRIYVFIWNWLYELYVCFILNVGDNLDFLKVFGIEIFRILLFVIKVLLVEGLIDRDVM